MTTHLPNDSKLCVRAPARVPERLSRSLDDDELDVPTDSLGVLLAVPMPLGALLTARPVPLLSIASSRPRRDSPAQNPGRGRESTLSACGESARPARSPPWRDDSKLAIDTGASGRWLWFRARKPMTRTCASG
jgi:hypothetical protein